MADGISDEIARENVVAAFRGLLGRDPESEAVLGYAVKHYTDLATLLRQIIASKEYQERTKSYASVVNQTYYQIENPVQADVPADVFRAIFERIVGQWTAIGEAEPYWSVLSADEYKLSNIDKTKEKFYSSGQGSYKLIELFCRRNQVERPRGACMELGCGVGRVTRFLADNFERVIGFDISEPNLQLAATHLKSARVANVELRLLRDLIDLAMVGRYSFFYSIIVLQHNPPPIMKRMLQLALGQLAPGGAFLFQIPTHKPGYAFDPSKYLSTFDPKGSGFEMHVLPMHEVFDAIADAGCRAKEVIADNSTGEPGSHTFFGVKPAV